MFNSVDFFARIRPRLAVDLLLVAAVALAVADATRSDAAAQSAALRAVIDGVVADTNLAPIAGVEASIVGSSLRVVTGANGRFQIVGLVPGEYTLSLQHRGYNVSTLTLQVVAGDTARLSLTLVPATVASDTAGASLQAAARRTTFEIHRARGRGQFITEVEIAQRNAPTTRELLRTLSSIRIQGAFASSARANTFRDACAFQLFVDGAPLKSTNLDGLPAPPALIGLEVYAVLDAVPLEYQAFRGDFCGAIVAWTRSGA